MCCVCLIRYVMNVRYIKSFKTRGYITVIHLEYKNITYIVGDIVFVDS